jgi:hypothetical protein
MNPPPAVMPRHPVGGATTAHHHQHRGGGIAVFRFGHKPPTAYQQAHNRAVELWALLGAEPDPAVRQAVYREMASTYNRMADAWVPDDVPGGYDGDFTEDLADMAALCWILAASEGALASPGSSGVPLQSIPGAAASSPLAAAWEEFWAAGERAERARLLRGHFGGPVRRGQVRQPAGIVPLSAGHVGSVVLGLLEAAADTEERLAEMAAVEAVR